MLTRVVFNQKGGVGKTTIVCNLAAISAAKGKRTLVIDLDPQCNSSQYLLSSQGLQAEAGSAEFFENSLKLRLPSNDLTPFITETPFDNLHLMAAHSDLEEIRVKLETRHKIYKLRQALEKLKGYDAIYIDTPPALNFYSRSALIASDRCLIPFDCDDFARQALYTLFDNIGEIRADHNEDLVVDGIVVNQFQSRARLPAQLVNELIEEGQPILKTRIPASVKVKESHDQSVPLISCAPKHKVTEAFVDLYKELSRLKS
ncbi:MAG: ParA family protein [Salinisphaeraceae bacterium]|nr:ParA family protein [Salinisphaeraceae bacterium]